MKRRVAHAVLAGCTCIAVGCASLGPQPVRVLDPDLRVGALGERTQFEAGAPRRADEPSRGKNVTKPLFWTGVAMASIGVVGLAGFGIGGIVTEQQLDDGYDEGISHSREDQLNARGEAFNALTITSAVIGLAGLILGATVYGIDYTRCGPLAPKRRNCQNR